MTPESAYEALDDAGREALARKLQRNGYGGVLKVERQHAAFTYKYAPPGSTTSSSLMFYTFDGLVDIEGLNNGTQDIMAILEKYGWIITGFSQENHPGCVMMSFVMHREVTGPRAECPAFDLMRQHVVET